MLKDVVVLNWSFVCTRSSAGALADRCPDRLGTSYTQSVLATLRAKQLFHLFTRTSYLTKHVGQHRFAIIKT